MSQERRKWLVACGAGAGIAATFNAPIAGVIFAMEVILHGSSLRSFASIVLATVTGSVIGRMYFGDEPAFTVPAYSYESNLEILFYMILGLSAAFIGIFYTKLIYYLEDLFDRIKLSVYLKAAIGGLLIGIVASIWPEVRGVGYEAITAALNSNMLWQIMLVLMAAKILATALTLGSGGSGGIFAPALFIGAMMGGALGSGFEALAPDYTAGSAPYALVGMAAVFSAAARAPFTSIIILFELTGNYNIILPLMLSVVLATVIANHYMLDSIYTFKLVRRGVRLNWGASADLLEDMKVRDVMHTEMDTVRENTTKSSLYEMFMETHHNGFPVLDKNNRLVGIVTLNDYHNAANLPPFAPVDRFCSHNLLTVNPTDNLSTALKKLHIRDVGRLPVVSEQDPTSLVGIITRTDILTAYELALRRVDDDPTGMDMALDK
jgi:CIC family chloride channel protein